ncbi:MAG: hypothetical protein HUJ29_12880 [Gammaproteobacteria bacterium]|nr:hypothetical protein [Gammaproteobacteria bacterium]
MNEENDSEIIEKYSEALVNTDHIVGKASELPYTKEVIGEVLLAMYSAVEDAEERKVLEEAYLKLESFISDEDYQAMSEYISLLADLKQEVDDQEKVFELAAEQIPDTSLEVLDVLNKIEENLKRRKQDLQRIQSH